MSSQGLKMQKCRKIEKEGKTIKYRDRRGGKWEKDL